MPKGIPLSGTNAGWKKKGEPAYNRGVPCSSAQKDKLKQAFKGRARTPYGRGGQPSPIMLEYAKILCAAGYEMDSITIPIPTGSAYKLDFALCDAKINIEIDGRTHRGREEQDHQRDEYLRSLGWKIIRIKHD